MVVIESSSVREIQSGGILQTLGVEGNIPGGLNFHWEDEYGNRHYFAEATQKEARTAVRVSLKMLRTQDDIRAMCSSIVEEMQTSETAQKVQCVKEFGMDLSTWFDRFHPTDRQWRVVLLIARELANYLVKHLAKCIEMNSVMKPTIQWEIEFLSGDGGIYQMLLKRCNNEGFTSIHDN